MKFSIITVVYNKKDHIEDCIKSVLSQSYKDIEHIIVDGKSTDGTMDIINKYRDKISKIISEKDEGYTYAMNKGLKVATGEIIAFLHSDDFYANNEVIEKVANIFKEKAVDSLYGDLVYVNKDNPKQVVRYWKGGSYSVTKFGWGWMVPHPTFFVKKDIYRKYGYFNTDFHIAADYEIILRLLWKYKISIFYLPQVLVKMRTGGTSNKGILNIVKKTIEDYKACKLHSLKRKFSIIALKNISKTPQFFIGKRNS